MMNLRVAVLAVLAVGMMTFAADLRADDYYLIDMRGLGQHLSGCDALLWTADTVFYNLGSSDATVSLAGVSNGSINATDATSFSVPAGRTTSLHAALPAGWQPNGGAAMWVVHVTAPASVVVDSEMLPSHTNPFCAAPLLITQSFGKTRLPFFRSLVPANQRQLIAGLTLGDLAGHINVSIYDGGSATANAAIEVHRACDGAIVDSRNVSVSANEVQQFTGFSVPDTSAQCTSSFNGLNGMNRLAYVTVTADQPSVSFASILGAADVPVSNIKDVPVSTVQVSGGVAQ